MLKNKFILALSLKIFFILFVFGLAATANYFLLKQINKVSLTMREKKEINYLLQNREANNLKIQTDLLAVDGDYDRKIREALPSVYNILPFVEALDSVAKKNSVRQDLNFNQPLPTATPLGPIALANIDFSAGLSGGNIDIFINYLKNFEKLPYFAGIHSISFVSNGDWQDNSSISLSGRFYARQ